MSQTAIPSKLSQDANSDLQPTNTDAKAAILSLPNELLGLVLESVARLEPPRDAILPDSRTYGPLERDVALGFLRLSEVCVRFRAVLISLAALWGEVACYLPCEPGTLALEFSQSSPLMMHIRAPDDWRMAMAREPHFPDRARLVALTVEHGERISSLTAYNLSGIDHRRIFKTSLPLLKEIDLTSGAERLESGALADVFIDAPSLRRARFAFLDVLGFTILPSSTHGFMFALPALRSLDVVLGDLGKDGARTLGWFVDGLQSLPVLESLRVEFEPHYYYLKWDTLLEGRQVRLARLQSLELAGCSASNMAILSAYICASRPAKYLVAIEDFEEDIDDMATAVKSFGSSLQHPSYDGLLVRLKPEHDACMLEVAVFPALDKAEHYSSLFPNCIRDVARLSVKTYVASDHPMHRQIVDIIVSNLRRNGIKQLIVDAPSFKAWPFALQSILPVCTAVRELIIRHPWDSRYPAFPVFPSPGILPALDTLAIRPIVIVEYGESFRFWWEEFLAWLERRTITGPRVRRLRILGPNYPLGKRRTVQDRRDAEMCARAAKFVDELSDERFGKT